MCDNVKLAADGMSVRILDQTRLPNDEVYLDLTTAEACFDAIARLAVRGAPAIGIFAAAAFAMLAKRAPMGTGEEFRTHMQQTADYLNASRPTAVNLSWALRRMMGVLDAHAGEGRPTIEAALVAEARAVQDEDVRTCERMAELGLTLIEDGWGLITHCNAGPLATSAYGTALGPMLLGHERGMSFHVYADETRPLLQGARLTSYELDRAGVDVTLICDNMASIVMKQGWVQACFVGCDRVAANGDDIPIELRDPDEIKTMFYERPMAPESVACYNPAFDVTDHELITAIVTERGILRPPFTESIEALFA